MRKVLGIRLGLTQYIRYYDPDDVHKLMTGVSPNKPTGTSALPRLLELPEAFIR